jgi:hypothetical protein
MYLLFRKLEELELAPQETVAMLELIHRFSMSEVTPKCRLLEGQLSITAYYTPSYPRMQQRNGGCRAPSAGHARYVCPGCGCIMQLAEIRAPKRGHLWMRRWLDTHRMRTAARQAPERIRARHHRYYQVATA